MRTLLTLCTMIGLGIGVIGCGEAKTPQKSPAPPIDVKLGKGGRENLEEKAAKAKADEKPAPAPEAKKEEPPKEAPKEAPKEPEKK